MLNSEKNKGMCRTEFPNAMNSLLSIVQASGMFMQLAYVMKKINYFNKDTSKQTLHGHMFASHAVVLADTTNSFAHYSSSHRSHHSRGQLNLLSHCNASEIRNTPMQSKIRTCLHGSILQKLTVLTM
jgi:hypothetical protein